MTRHLKKVKGKNCGNIQGRSFQVEGTASVKALQGKKRLECVRNSMKAMVELPSEQMGEMGARNRAAREQIHRILQVWKNTGFKTVEDLSKEITNMNWPHCCVQNRLWQTRVEAGGPVRKQQSKYVIKVSQMRMVMVGRGRNGQIHIIFWKTKLIRLHQYQIWYRSTYEQVFFLKSWTNDDILCDEIAEDDQVWGGQSTEHLERLSLSVNTE